jgi:multidrug resistance efflux pump
VTLASLRPGDAVKQGDVLVNLFDNQLEREIELSEITVREREARFSLLQRRVLEELNRLQSSVDMPGQQGAKIKLEIESLRARVQATEQEVRRVSAKPRDLQAPARIEEAKKKLLANQKALEGKQMELRTRLEREVLAPGNRTATSVASGQLALQQMTALEAQMAQAEQDYEFAQLRHQSIIAHRARLAVRAPYDGVLTGLPRTDRAVVRKGDVLATVEQRGVPEVTALVSQTEAGRVALGDGARLYVPSLGAYLPARVARIEQAPESQRGASHGAADMPVKVALSLDKPEQVQNRQAFTNGLPVVVQFQRRWTNTAAQNLANGASAGLATARDVLGPASSYAEPKR